MKNTAGFTLIEMMVVVTIIGILAAVSLPAYQIYIQRSEMTDALSMAGTLRENVTQHYVEHLSFPANNMAAGLPPEDKLIGNRITGVKVEAGAIHISIGNKASAPLQGKVLTFRPATVDGSPTSPISWLCGYDEPVSGMTAAGDNRTDVENAFLPAACRQRS